MSSPVLLHSHPTTPCPAVVAIEVRVVGAASGGLALAYALRGPVEAFAIPAPAASSFADGLWQHTCFEAFVSVAGSPAYHEFNFSPSGQWAAYAFSGYRQRDESRRFAGVPQLAVRRSAQGLEVDAFLPAGLLPACIPGQGFEIALSAVVESRDGNRSYWALAHATPQPDFHQRAAFILPLVLPDSLA